MRGFGRYRKNKYGARMRIILKKVGRLPLSIHYKNILNYFDNRSTNASAESFNAKIKAFRALFRGVRNVDFFLFRLTSIFA